MIRRLFLFTFFLALVGAGALYWFVGRPYSGFDNEVFVDIPPGTSTRSMARQLQRAGVIENDWQFLIARAFRPTVVLQAGEYRFDHATTVFDVYSRIARGDIFYHELRVPEGSNMFDIAASVEKLGLMKAATFLAAARRTALVKDLAPDAPSLEGYLFPSTYRITRRTTAEQICREMTGAFRKVWRELGGARTNVNQLVTLASLVEKETAVPAERGTVASVYVNRLRIGMKLDCDPTTIYAALLQGRFRGTIYRSDLDSSHPYNTYQNRGLPPGAIANPGVDSLKAALTPAQTKYLFFVAKPDGSGAHSFSETLEAHNLAVAAYRNGLR